MDSRWSPDWQGRGWGRAGFRILFGLWLISRTALGQTGESETAGPLAYSGDQRPVSWAAQPILEPEPERERGELETDRDSFTPAISLAGPGLFIVESAYTFIDNRDVYDTHSLPELVLRRGVTDWLELRLHFNYEVGGAGNAVSAEAGDEEFSEGPLERESQIGYGFKLKVSDQQGWLPGSALLLVGNTPTSGPEDSSSFVGTYVVGWNLPNEWKLDSALRYSADSIRGDGHDLWSPSVVVKVPLMDRLNGHVEYFGIFTSHKAVNSNAQYFSPGVHFLATEDLEIGVRVGWGLNQDAAAFFVNTGIGWRF